MPRYHFNVVSGASLPDREGVDLPDLRTAQTEAVRFSAQSLAELAETFWETEEWKLNVSDGEGLILFNIHITGMQAPVAWPGHHGPVLDS